MSFSAQRIAGLYAIADSTYLQDDEFVPTVRAVLTGGARVIQYRDKKNPAARQEIIARALVTLCHKYDVPLLINDNVQLAKAVGAAGVHLGRDDMEIGVARGVLGPTAIIGVSCYNELDLAQAAQAAGANYVAFGRFFPSHTKPMARQASPDLLRMARAALSIPIVAIGGITPENGASLVEAGASALAVIEGVFNQHDKRVAAERYAKLYNQ